MNLSYSLPVLLVAFAGLRPVLSAPAPAPENTVLVAAATTSAAVREESSELIPWTARRIVGWADFQSAPQRSGEAVASTSTSLALSYQVKDGELSYSIACNFQKTKSWGLMKNDYILAHEQGHFDITEICARKLYKALSEYQFDRRHYKADLTRIYNAIVKEKEDLQEVYDHETDHSRNRTVQQQWLDRIESELAGSEAFAQYP